MFVDPTVTVWPEFNPASELEGDVSHPAKL